MLLNLSPVRENSDCAARGIENSKMAEKIK